MTPAARVEAAIDVLQELETSPLPADRFLRDWFRRRRYAGSKDRAAVAERVFDVLRHRNSFAWRMQSESPRALVIGSLLHERKTPESIRALFSGEGYGPSLLSEEEFQAINLAPRGEPPLHVQGEYPQWLEPELRRGFGEHLLDETVALQTRAPIDLRVNTLKTSRNDVLRKMLEEGFAAEPMRYSPVGIRIPSGARGLEKTAMFGAGAFELQDEASQIAALLVDAEPGMRVLDLAAGAGGKSLAIASQMQNEGEIVASDIDAGRLRQLAIRADRAGVKIIFPLPHEREGEDQGEGAVQASRTPSPQPSPPLREGEGAGLFDRVLVDAPCSGTGTWRRQPELRWRLTPDRLVSLKDTQASLLEEGAQHVRPGGRLVYTTCSILPSENEDQIPAFLERHPDFTILPAQKVWSEAVGTEPAPGMNEFFRAGPLATGTDGFFAAVLARAAELS